MSLEWDSPMVIFGFVIAIVFIGSLFNYLTVRSKNETLKSMAQSGQAIDPALLGHLGKEDSDGGGGLITGGAITMAVAIGLYIFGQQLGVATDDPEVGPVFRAIAGLVGVIALGLLVTGIGSAMFRRRKSDDI